MLWGVADAFSSMHPCIITSEHATVCLLTRDATMSRGAATTDAAALSQAMACKERTKSELAVRGFRAHLVVLGAEIGGRWLPETQDFLSGRAAQKATSVPARVPEQGHCSMAARVDVGSSRDNARVLFPPTHPDLKGRGRERHLCECLIICVERQI